VCTAPSGALSSDWGVGGVGSHGGGVESANWRLQLTGISANTLFSAIRVTFLKFDVECDRNNCRCRMGWLCGQVAAGGPRHAPHHNTHN
jgi:hypothetical protein